MRTLEQFNEDSYRGMLLMCNYLKDRGYNTKYYYNINGDMVVSVTLSDSEGEEVEYTAMFERV